MKNVKNIENQQNISCSKHGRLKNILTEITNIFGRTKQQNYDSNTKTNKEKNNLYCHKLTSFDENSMILEADINKTVNSCPTNIKYLKKQLPSHKQKFHEKYKKNKTYFFEFNQNKSKECIKYRRNSDNEEQIVLMRQHNRRLVIKDMDAFNESSFIECVLDYQQDIYKYMLHQEKSAYVVNDYSKFHKKISNRIRVSLIEWMINFQIHYELSDDVLHDAFSYINLYLSRTKDFDPKMLRLLAGVSFSLANKFEDGCNISFKSMRSYCNFMYKTYEFVKMECNLLTVLNYYLNVTTSYKYLKLWAYKANLNYQSLTFARYLVECSQYCYSYVTIPPSILACACFLLTLYVFENKSYDTWDTHFKSITYYSFSEIIEITKNIINFVQNNSASFQVLQFKYGGSSFFNVTNFKLPPSNVFDL